MRRGASEYNIYNISVSFIMRGPLMFALFIVKLIFDTNNGKNEENIFLALKNFDSVTYNVNLINKTV